WPPGDIQQRDSQQIAGGHSVARIAAQARERQPREILLRPKVDGDRTGQPADPQALPQLTDGARNGIIDRQSHGSLWRPAEHPAHTPAAAANRPADRLCSVSQATYPPQL